MIDEEAIKLFQSLFGGNYYKEKPNCNNGKPLYCYQASDLKAFKICKILYPYLIIKKKNVERIMKLRESKDTMTKEDRPSRFRKMAQSVLDYREELYKQCKKK